MMPQQFFFLKWSCLLRPLWLALADSGLTSVASRCLAVYAQVVAIQDLARALIHSREGKTVHGHT